MKWIPPIAGLLVADSGRIHVPHVSNDWANEIKELRDRCEREMDSCTDKIARNSKFCSSAGATRGSLSSARMCCPSINNDHVTTRPRDCSGFAESGKKRWASLDHVIRPEFSTKSSFDCVSSEFCHAKNVFKLLNLHSNRLLIISAIEWKLFRHFSAHSSAARGLKRKWLWNCWSTALFFPDFDGGYLGRIQSDSFRNCFNVLCPLSSIEWAANRIRLTKQQPANAVWIRTLVTAEGNLNQLMEIESDLTRYATNRLPVSVGSPDRQVSVWTMNFSPAIDRFVKWPLASRDNVHQIIRLRRRQRHSHRISRRRTN